MSELWVQVVEWEFHPRPRTNPITAGQAIGDIPNAKSPVAISQKVIDRWERTPPGENMWDFGCGPFKLHKHRVSPALIRHGDAGYSMFHYQYPRPLLVSEMKRIQSFSDDFVFLGTYKEIKDRIGNSVPPKLMQAIAENIKRAPFMSTKNPTVISTFAGCGGSSLGYKMAGFRELLAVEWDNNAVATFKLNFPDVPVFHEDIAKLSGEECCKLAGIKPGELDILDGSPPCQGFSTAGKRKFDDPRNSLFKEYARLLEYIQPKVFVMENVTGMVKGVMKQAYLQIIKTLRECGYRAKGEVLNAMYYGVPQSRQRVIIIGVRNDLGIKPSHPKPLAKIISAEEAISEIHGKVVPFKPMEMEYWKKMSPGENASKYHPKGHWYLLRKLNPRKPCPTIEKSGGPRCFMHWSEPRFLWVKEWAALASFPESFLWSGTDGKAKQRIGNSVPPLLMKAIAEHIRKEILSDG